MLSLSFVALSAENSFRTAPTTSFRIDADTITAVDGTRVAVRNGPHWRTRDDSYARIDCSGPVTVTRIGSEERSKTYNQLTIDSDSIQGDGRHLAVLTDAGEWL